jgi:hypothetical protein
MNSYSTNSFFNEGFKTSSVSLLYVIIPLFIGTAIDILFTQILGLQFCSLNKTEYVCNIHGLEIKQWQREAVRLFVQFGLIMCAFILLQNYNSKITTPLYSSLLGVTGLVLFFITQQDLFSDFRRLCNGIVFTVKHI